MATALEMSPILVLTKTVAHLDTLMNAKAYDAYAVALQGLGPLVEAVVNPGGVTHQAHCDLEARVAALECA